MKNPLSLRILHVISQISFWGILTLIVFFFALIAITLLDQPLDIKIDYNVNLNYETEVSYVDVGSISNIPVDLVFDKGSIKIPMKHLDKETLIYSFTGLTLIFICLLAIASFFRKFMKQVLRGNTFNVSSIQLIKNMAWGLVALEIMLFVYNNFVYQFISKNIISAFTFSQKISFPSTALILALCLWALAHIFTKGKELEDEQKLTV